MAYGTFEDYERLARTNEDRFEQIETELNRALELLANDELAKATERIEQAAHMAGTGVRLNIMATQK